MGSPRIYSTNDLDLIEEQMRRQAHRSLWAYRQYMRPDLLRGWWQKDLCYHLAYFFAQMARGERPKLLIVAPPQHGKSETVTDALSWFAGHHRDHRMIYTSFSENLGVKANSTLQRHFDSRKFQSIFGQQIYMPGGQGTYHARNQSFLEYVEGGGSFRNTTVRGPITGEGLDLGIIDDPVKGREEANSPTIRNKTWDWFLDDFFSRFSNDAGLLGIMTRWHVDDVFGRIIEAFPDVIVLRYPALAEPGVELMPQDPRTPGDGAPLFPELKSREFLLERKAAMHSSSWASLYQGNPIIVGGDLFHDDWWRYWRELPQLEYRCIYADTAQKTKSHNDYSVFQCWGKGMDRQIYLIDQIRGKWEAPELQQRARAFWDKHNAMTGQGKLRAMKVEDKVSGTGLIQHLVREGIPVLGIQRGQDKITRAMDVSPSIEAGLVCLPAGAPFLSDFLEEAGAFPNGAFDDQLDPMMDAIDDMIGLTQTKYAGVW